ncbi:MAG: exodeoxyribonuclease III [Candidatus Omnitrophica bacterium]|nr:exodeoxyribonuclease III [Candidatus Omnitrophota bacterium]
MKTLRIISWNVNGLRAVGSKGFPEWLKKESPDILCLQETKAHPEQVPPQVASPPGYGTFWNNPARRGYAGVAVFSKKKPAKVKKDFPSGALDTEGRALILDYEEFILMNVYFPNGRMNPDRLRYKLDFYDAFLEYVKSVEEKNIIITGDLNTAHNEIDLARPKENSMLSGFLPEERAWMDKLIVHGFVDTFRHFNKEPGHYTFWDLKTRARERNVGWRIDYFFVTKSLIPRVKNAFIMPGVMGSDHCPVGMELVI